MEMDMEMDKARRCKTSAASEICPCLGRLKFALHAATTPQIEQATSCQSYLCLLGNSSFDDMNDNRLACALLYEFALTFKALSGAPGGMYLCQSSYNINIKSFPLFIP